MIAMRLVQLGQVDSTPRDFGRCHRERKGIAAARSIPVHCSSCWPPEETNEKDSPTKTLGGLNLFSVDPIADVCRTVLELYTIRFATLQAPHCVAIRQFQVPQIQE